MELRGFLFGFIKIAVLAYLGVLVLIYFIQEKMLFFPTKLAKDFKFSFKAPFEEKWTTAGQDQIHSILFKAPDAKGIILYFHGNAGSLESWGEVAERLCVEIGWDVWILDYPGYGKSTGKIKSQEQLLQMGQAVYLQIKKEFPDLKIAIYGRSIGSGIAVHLAGQNEIYKLILETPYTSLTDLQIANYPYIPTVLLKYPMPSKEWIKEVKVPILIMHGTNDEVIPFSHAQEMAKIARGSTFIEFIGAYHNDLSDFKQYQGTLLDFLNH